MTDKQLKRLKKIELLEIMIAQDKELEALRKRNKELEQQMKLLRDLFEKFLKTKTDRTTGRDSFRERSV